VEVANGVTPEQMHMYMQDVLHQIHPQVVRDSVSAVQDRRRRYPSSKQ
jgi:hypothetical protein